MKYIITGRNLTVTEALKAYVEKKFSKFDRYFKEDAEIHVTLRMEGNSKKAEVTIPMKGNTVHAEEIGDDMYPVIDLLADIVERKLRRNRKKLIDRRQNVPSLSEIFFEEQGDGENEEPEKKIVRTKHFDMKPMDPQEACFQMELSGHNFFVFRNAQTGNINVVYLRKDGNYGLIEPEE